VSGHSRVFLEAGRKPSEPGVRRSEVRESLRLSLDGERPRDFREDQRHRSLEEDMDRHMSSSSDDDDGVDEDFLETFPISEGLTTEEANALLREHGPNLLPENITPGWLLFLQQLWQPMPLLIWLAAIIEGAIGNYIDTAILVSINLLNASLSYYEMSKAGKAVESLKSSLQPTAICKRDGKWNHEFDATQLVPGDLIELGAGMSVPADCMMNPGGMIECDESAMTGETLPVAIHERQLAKQGATVARGEHQATVVLTGKNTFFGKTAAMLDNDSERTNLQKLLLRIVIILSVMALVMGTTCFVFLMVTGEDVKEALSFAVVVIVASIPMAIEIVVTTTLALGSRSMSSFGAIVSRLSAIEDLAGVDMLCSDKTGTLTKNKMEIQPETPVFEQGITQMDLLRYAALAARWQQPPKDALDTLVLRCDLWFPGAKDETDVWFKAHPDATQDQLDAYTDHNVEHKMLEELADFELIDHIPFDPRFKRTESTVRNKKTNQIFKVTKGAPHVIQELDLDQTKRQEATQVVSDLGAEGVRCMAIAVSNNISEPTHIGEPTSSNTNTDDVEWSLLGLLSFLDPPRSDTKDTIRRAQDYGVPVKMITGDHLLIAKKTCRDLDMGNKDKPGWPDIQGPTQLPLLNPEGKPPKDLLERFGSHIEASDGFAQVFPEHKYLIVETYRQLGYTTGMTGDGVNDAPALKRADVGIAVAGATDAARAAADIVLTEEGLSTIVLGIEIARQIFHRMKSFLTYRISATLQLLFFFFIALFAFHSPKDYLPDNPPAAAKPEEWPDFFHLPVLYLMIITVINDGTLISVGYDHALVSKRPQRWHLPVLFIVGGTLAAVACFSSLLLLYLALDSWNDNSLFQLWGIGGLEYGQITNAIFLQVAVGDILTLFSARTSAHFFWSRSPHWFLVVACMCALTTSTLLGLFLPCTEIDDVFVCGLAYEAGQYIALWIWLYCIFWFFVQDAVKVGVFWLLIHYNAFDINEYHHHEIHLEEKDELPMPSSSDQQRDQI